MKTTVNGNFTSGCLADAFTQQELDSITKYLGSTLPKKDNMFFQGSVYPGHILYTWLDKKIVPRIKELVGIDTHLLFGGYLNETVPLGLHSDYYHKTVGEPYASFLIPMSADNGNSPVEQVHTVIFNEDDLYVDVTGKQDKKVWLRSEWDQNKTVKDNNALQYFDQHLSHFKSEDLECLTVQNIVPWKLGSMLYWSSRLLHGSDNFVKNNVKSKQALVLHTYVL